MTSVATGIGVCCAVGLNMAAAFVQQTPPPPNPKPPLQTSAKATEAEITVTGCLVQGSTANVFILQNAKRDPQSATEKAARYVVVPATEDLFLKQHLNHTVRILGVPDGRPQPTPQAASAVDEKLVPALSTKSLTMVTASCGGSGGGDWSDGNGSSEGGAGHANLRSRGGSIGLGSGRAGFFGSSLASTSGSAGARFGSVGSSGLYGGIGFARTSSVTGGFSEGAPSDLDQESEFFDDVVDWTPPSASNLFDGPGVPTSATVDHIPAFAASYEPPSQAVEAQVNHVARTTARELPRELPGEDAPAGLAMAPAVLDAPIVNPQPGTLLLIASGLLLVVYAGRRGEWKPFSRRSAR